MDKVYLGAIIYLGYKQSKIVTRCIFKGLKGRTRAWEAFFTAGRRLLKKQISHVGGCKPCQAVDVESCAPVLFCRSFIAAAEAKLKAALKSSYLTQLDKTRLTMCKQELVGKSHIT